MYRQNTILNDFINFLKARGRFRDIEFVENSIHATPRIPDLPSLIFYVEEDRSEQHYILEIHGNESTVMNREIQEFFQLNNLNIQSIKTKNYLTTDDGDTLGIEIEGLGSAFEKIQEQILLLLEDQKYTISKTQKTLIFGHENSNQIKEQIPSQLTKKNQRNQSKTPVLTPASMEISPVKTKQINAKKSSVAFREVVENEDINMLRESTPISKKTDTKLQPIQPKSEIDLERTAISQTEKKLSENDFDEISDELKDEFDIESISDDMVEEEEDSEADLFRIPVSKKEFSDDITPYLKQTTSLFRRNNWERDLPTELEMEILERTYSRIKHRTKPEILAKDLDMSIEEAEKFLRSLISKGLLRTQVGWYIIKKSHLPFFKRTFAETDKKKRKKKSPRISRVGEGLTPEEIATIKAIKSRPNMKAQSNLLTRPTGLKQSILKEVLRNLVDKGILRVSYGWYILKDKNILEHKRGVSTNSIDTTESEQYDIPSELNLTTEEQKIIQALLQRPQYKAQSNLLAPEVKLPKDQIKQVLRELVEKDICKVTYGWYQLKDPEQFLLK